MRPKVSLLHVITPSKVWFFRIDFLTFLSVAVFPVAVDSGTITAALPPTTRLFKRVPRSEFQKGALSPYSSQVSKVDSSFRHLPQR